MTPEAQRIAIAEVCGKDIESFRFWRKGYNDTEWRESPHYRTKEVAEYWREKESHWGETELVESICSHQNLPDYLNDLNACHEMEKVLTDDQLEDYADHLHKWVASGSIGVAALRATAAQRCEAFLRTLNLWDDTK